MGSGGSINHQRRLYKLASKHLGDTSTTYIVHDLHSAHFDPVPAFARFYDRMWQQLSARGLRRFGLKLPFCDTRFRALMLGRGLRRWISVQKSFQVGLAWNTTQDLCPKISLSNLLHQLFGVAHYCSQSHSNWWVQGVIHQLYA